MANYTIDWFPGSYANVESHILWELIPHKLHQSQRWQPRHLQWSSSSRPSFQIVPQWAELIFHFVDFCLLSTQERWHLINPSWRIELLHTIATPDPVLIVSVSKVAMLFFEVQTLSSSQRRLTAGAESEADGPRQEAVNLTSLSLFLSLSLPLSSAPVQSAYAAQAVVEHLWNHSVCTIILTVNDLLLSSKRLLITHHYAHAHPLMSADRKHNAAHQHLATFGHAHAHTNPVNTSPQ